MQYSISIANFLLFFGFRVPYDIFELFVLSYMSRAKRIIKNVRTFSIWFARFLTTSLIDCYNYPFTN